MASTADEVPLKTRAVGRRNVSIAEKVRREPVHEGKGHEYDDVKVDPKADPSCEAKDVLGLLQDDLQDREREATEHLILSLRIETLQKTLDSKSMTIESQRQTISYQEAQIKRLRDAIYLLRGTVAELSECLKHNFINLPNTMQELPPVDEALENWRHYENKTREEVAEELENLMAEYSEHAEKQLAAKPSHLARAKSRNGPLRATLRQRAPSGELLPTKPEAAPTKTARKCGGRSKFRFSELSLAAPEKPKRASEIEQKRTPAHPSAPKTDRVTGSLRNVAPEVSREDTEETPANVVCDADRTFDTTFACDATKVVRVVLKSQFQRQAYSSVLMFLLGKKAQKKFEDKFTQMLVETVCACIVSKNIGYHYDLRNFMPQWVQILVELTESERGTLFTYDEDSGELYSRVLTGSFKAPLRIQKGTGIAGHVFESGTPVIVDDCYEDLRFNPTTDRRTKLKTRSILCAPIVSGPKIVGVLELLNKKTGDYTKDDLRLVEVLGTVIAPGLTSTKVHKQLKKSHAHEARMLKQAITGDKVRFMSPLVREIMKCVSSILDTERCTLFLSDADRGKLWAIVSQGVDNIHIEIPNNRGIAGAVFTNNMVLNIPDCYNDPRFNQAVDTESGFRTRSILCSPIPHAVSGKPIGVIQAINKVGGAFTQSDEQRIEQLCSMVSSIIITSDSLEELTVSAELNERIYQCLSVATVILNSIGHCMKVNRDAADLFFLENSSQWCGKHCSELFGLTNPTLYQMWTLCLETQEEQTSNCLAIYPFVGEAEGDLRSCRIIPFSSEGQMIGAVMTFTPTYAPKM